MKLTRRSFIAASSAAVVMDWKRPAFAVDALRPFGAGARIPGGRIQRLLARALAGNNWGGTLKRVVISLMILVILQNSVFLFPSSSAVKALAFNPFN